MWNYRRNCKILKISTEEKDLPLMYGNFYKYPCRTRFIIAFKFCSTQELSKSTCSVLKQTYNQV